MKYSDYKALLNTIETQEDMEQFIDTIADDMSLSGRQYENLRLLAIDTYYNN